MALGERIGTYQVLEKLGAGGMGEVYRGRDTKLNRDVAIKTLPELFASDPERAARFEREAQVLASLNHPHIAQVYGVVDHPPALIMELVPGESLAQRLAHGAMSLPDALAIARQIALALEAAHDKGIVHRDLKPGNVMLTPDDEVKVLDFGLARIVEPEAASNPSHSPTLTFAATQMGVVLGTAAYMSPEQAKGRVVDKRSDVWSFGCVLYELLTGARAFAGEDISDTLAAVLRGEPDWTKLPADTPPRLTQLLRRCLTKDRAQRIPDISVARYEIEHALSGSDSGPVAQASPVAPQRRNRTAVIAALSLLGGAAAAALFFWISRPEAPAGRMVRFQVPAPEGARVLNRASNPAIDVAVSRDGTQLAYRVVLQDGGSAMALRRLDEAEASILPGTAGATSAVFSPDGQALAFYADQKLKVLTLGTAQPITACDAVGQPGIDWIDNDTIAFVHGPGIRRVSRLGGTPTDVAVPPSDAQGHGYRYPEVTPDGRVLLYTAEDPSGRRIVAQSLSSGERKDVVANASYPKYLASGHLVFLLGGRTVAAAFDAGTMQVTGNPVPIDEGITERLSGGANFDVSPEGTFAALTGSSVPYISRFAWFNRTGAILSRIGDEDLEYPRYPRLSPDGRRFVGTVGAGIRGQLWAFDVAGTAQPLKLTSSDHNVWPSWFPDGKSFVFVRMLTATTSEGPRQSIMSIPSDGSTLQPQLLTPLSIPGRSLPTISPDGKWLLVAATRPNTGMDLLLKPLKEPGELRPWIAERFQEEEPAFSPDGKWVAYTSNVNGTMEVWVRPFPGPGAPLRVSANGGREPVWSRNGKELFFQEQRKLMAATMVSTDPITFTRAVVLFEGSFVRSDEGTPRTYDVAPDGRFLMIENKPNPAVTMVNVVTGWGELVRQKVR